MSSATAAPAGPAFSMAACTVPAPTPLRLASMIACALSGICELEEPDGLLKVSAPWSEVPVAPLAAREKTPLPTSLNIGWG
eukprot:767890-Alexandrium_andersonii.AAC.1